MLMELSSLNIMVAVVVVVVFSAGLESCQLKGDSWKLAEFRTGNGLICCWRDNSATTEANLTHSKPKAVSLTFCRILQLKLKGMWHLSRPKSRKCKSDELVSAQQQRR